MKLDKLIIHRLPGMPGGFELQTSATVSVIIGPNGSGKSSLTRAVLNLLWSDSNPGTPFSVEAFFTWESAQWKAVREEGMQTRWLREGQQAETPDLPGDHVARCYELGLLDLVLPAGGEVEQQLAGIINREMSGGVNLAQIADDFFSSGPRTASKRSTQLQQATKFLNTLVRQQKQLSEQERELVHKQQDLDRSNSAAAISNLLEKLKTRNEMLIELEAVRFKINRFEPGQDKIRREDNDTLATLNRQRLEKKRQAQQAGTEVDIRRQQLQALDLPDQMTDSGLLARQVTEAASLHSEVQKLQEDSTRQSAILKQVLLELDPEADGAGPQPGREVYSDVSKAYSRLAELQAMSEGLDALLALPQLLIQDPDPVTRETWDKLRLWLESPAPGSIAPQVTALIAALIAGSSGWLLWSSGGQLPGIAAMGLGTFLAGYSAWRWFQIQSRNKDRKNLGAQIIAQCKANGITLEQPLQPAQIQNLLNDETRAETARLTRQALRDYLSGQQKLQGQKLENSSDLLDQLRRKHGLAMDLEAPDLINLLNAIPRLREARDEATALEAAIAEKQQNRDAVLETCSSSFAELGFSRPGTLLEVEQLLDELETRLTLRNRLQDEQKRYQEDLHRLQQDLKELDDHLSTFWNRLGLPAQDDDHLVLQLVDSISDWDATVAEESTLKHQVELLNREIHSKPALLDPDEAEKLTDDQLDLRLETLRTEAQSRDSLLAEITRIKVQVEQARDSLQVAEARSLQEAARANLLETRKQERQNTLGRLLLEDVQQTYHHASRPKVLARASDNFRDFTQGRYELLVLPGEKQNGRFAAFDVEKKENLRLSELSDGTRAQLLLAVRLAFIAVNEGAARPPIFLDESLTSSDPERFAAIADKLAGWAASQQRQVFYLSSNPNDATAWEMALKTSGLPHPEIFDLAKARSLDSGRPPSFDFDAPFIPPAPGNMTAAEYARVLMVPGLDLWHQSTKSHVWYILQDDLPQLHRLLLASAPSLGRLFSRKNDILVLGEMSARKLANLEARGHCLDAFIKNWRIGRNRPVTAETLISSGAVGPAFMDKCRDLLNEVKGDSEAFLAGLRAKKVKRFNTKKIEALEDYFRQENFLDPHDVLTEEDLLSNVYSAVQPEIKAGALEVVEVRTLVLSWWGLSKVGP